MMVMSESSEIQRLHDEIQELRLLYERIANDHVPREPVTAEDVESIEAPDGVVSKEEFLRALDGVPAKKRRKPSVSSHR